MNTASALPWTAGRRTVKSRAAAPKVVCAGGKCTWTHAAPKPSRPKAAGARLAR